MQKKWPIIAVLLLLASNAFSSIAVHAKLGDGQANVGSRSFLRFVLQNCGYNIPQYPPTSLVVVGKQFDLKPNQADGSIAGTILANNEILCGNVDSTFYRVTAMADDSTPAGQPQDFRICTASATNPETCSTVASLWDPAFAQPMTQPPPKPGFVTLFGNPLTSQTWKQPLNTKAIFLGTFDFTGATVLGITGGGGGTTVQVNGATVTTPNFNLLPAAPANFINCSFAVSVSNVSLACPIGATSATFAPGAGSTIYAPQIAPTFFGHVTVPTPTTGTDATTKTYVDSILTGGSNATQVQGRTVSAAAPNNLDYFGWNSGLAQWEPKPLPAASSNATQIQSVDVDSVGPTDTQGLVYDATALKYKAKNVIIGLPTLDQTISPVQGKTLYNESLNKVRYVVPGDNWVQSPAADLSATGSKTITLTPCPKGIDVSNTAATPFNVYISTTGTPEVALVTGGSCTSGGTTGTIVVTTNQSHSAGYTVGSAYRGIQEAINSAASPNAHVIIPPLGGNTSYDILAPVFFNSNKGTLEAKGAVIGCNVRSTCIYIGNATGVSSSNYMNFTGARFKALVNVDGAKISSVSVTTNVATVSTVAAHNLVTGDQASVEFYSVSDSGRIFGTVTVINGTSFTIARTHADYTTAAAFGWTGLKDAALEVTGDGNTIRDISFSSLGSPARFNFGVIVDNDQKFTLDGISNEGSSNVFRCGANFCGAAIRGRGDSNNAPVGYITHAELSLQCGGNGIQWTAGNSLTVKDSVIQGFAQYGVYYVGGLQSASLENVYQEVGSCTNPIYPGSLSAEAGVITGGLVKRTGPGPTIGQIPRFGNTGSTERNYFVVPRSTIFGYGPIMLAGYTLHNGSGAVNVYWPEIAEEGAGTVTYDLLITTGAFSSTLAAPYSGSATSITLNAAGACSNGVCTFSDTLGAGSAYTVVAQQWQPYIWFWPGSVVMSTMGNFSSSHGVNLMLHSDITPITALSGLISSLGSTTTSAQIDECNAATAWSPIVIQCASTGIVGPQFYANQYQQKDAANNGPAINTKGKLNFGGPWGTPSPTHLITLTDANSNKTFATPGGRPSNDSNDAFIGFDQGNTAATMGLSIGAGAGVTFYAGNVGDGTNWLQRLTASAATFKVPITVTNLTVTGTCTGCGAGSALGAANQIPYMNPAATNFNYDANFSLDPITKQLIIPGGMRSLASGPWSVEGPFGPMSDAGAGNDKLGFDIDGDLALSKNGGAQKKFKRSGEILPADINLSGASPWPALDADLLDSMDSSVVASANTIVASDGTGQINYTRYSMGKINPQTGNYTTVASDYEKLIKMNGVSLTVQLMAAPAGGYNLAITNIAATALTISRATCACNINGVTTSISLAKGQTVRLWSDGTDYQSTLPFTGDTVTGTTVTQVGQGLQVAIDPTVTNALLASQYTNATTVLTSLTGLAFPVAANTNYVMTCQLYYQTSATTGNLKLGLTGPGSPTSVHYSMDLSISSTASGSHNVASAFGGSISGSGTPTLNTDFTARLTMGLHNGASSGTVQLQAAATGVGTITIEPDSYCQLN